MYTTSNPVSMAPEQKTWQSMQAAKLLLSQPESLAGLSLSYTDHPSFRNILKHARLKGKDSICEGLAVRQVTGLPAPPSAVIRMEKKEQRQEESVRPDTARPPVRPAFAQSLSLA